MYKQHWKVITLWFLCWNLLISMSRRLFVMHFQHLPLFFWLEVNAIALNCWKAQFPWVYSTFNHLETKTYVMEFQVLVKIVSVGVLPKCLKYLTSCDFLFCSVCYCLSFLVTCGDKTSERIFVYGGPLHALSTQLTNK